MLSAPDRKARNGEKLQLTEVCKGSSIVREPPREPIKSPELLARLDKLQRAEQERQYKKMVHDVTGHVSPSACLKIACLSRKTNIAAQHQDMPPKASSD